jgi:Fe-S-cluster containining protein
MFVNDVYNSVDDAIIDDLSRLRAGGVIPSCKNGCSHCCRYNIQMNIAEAQTMVRFIKREFTKNQVRDLRNRTRKWHEWDTIRSGRNSPDTTTSQADSSDPSHYCPLLVNNVCKAYPVRPMVCRVHYVSSDPRRCLCASNPDSTEDTPEVLTSVIAVSRPFSQEVRDRIEGDGMDFSRSVMLLPHWLMIQMEWDTVPSQ